MEKYITIDNLLVFVLVFLAGCWAYNMISSAQQNYRKSRKEANAPMQEVKDELDAHQQMLAADKRRIELLEERAQKSDVEMKLLLKSQIAVVSHLLNGNSVDKLRDSMDEINAFLVDSK